MENPALLSTAVYQSNAYRTYLRFHLIGTNYFVFARNYEELKKLLLAAQSPDTFQKLWTEDKQEDMLLVKRELIRMLHNFIASAKTLVDHTRAVIEDWYSDTKFLEEYESEVQQRFVGNPVTGFIEELRNYALHFRLPITNARYTVATDPATQEQVATQAFVLDKSELMQWSKWTSKGTPYLVSADVEIVVAEIADHYYQEIRGFHDWMMKRLEEIHSDEIEWLKGNGGESPEGTASLTSPF
jgi:hypothetical protein